MYTWEAERNGEIITTGGDLTGCSRVALVPEREGLPRHDLRDIPFVRRFGRSFLKSYIGNSSLSCELHWVQGEAKAYAADDTDLTVQLEPKMLIRRDVTPAPWYMILSVEKDHIVLHKPYEERTKTATAKFTELKQSREYLHCIVCQGFRVWVDTKGQMLITSEDEEVYL